MNKREQVIRFLNKKVINSTSNIVSISQNDLKNINLSEREIIQVIYLLAEDKLIRIIDKSVHDDFSRYWNIALTSDCVDYFENKKIISIANRREWIKTYIPITLSISAIIISILSLVVK